jgi:SAM-dependent methyltransferase
MSLLSLLPDKLKARWMPRMGHFVMKWCPNFLKPTGGAVKHWYLNREVVARMYLRGEGIEIGALWAPLHVPKGVTVRYVDRMDLDGLRKHYPELKAWKFVPVDIIADGESLATIPDASQDFVILNGVLEHYENPLRALENMIRVTRKGGMIYLAIPDKRFTFDVKRDVTPIAHLLDEYHGRPSVGKYDHFADFIRHTTAWKTEQELTENIRKFFDQDYSIHYHVWTQWEILDMLLAARRQLGIPFDLKLIYEFDYGFLVMLQKA